MLSTLGVMTIGITMGVVAGYFRGWIDAVISRIIEVTMAFPALLFIIALAATIGRAAQQHHLRRSSARAWSP